MEQNRLREMADNRKKDIVFWKKSIKSFNCDIFIAYQTVDRSNVNNEHFQIREIVRDGLMQLLGVVVELELKCHLIGGTYRHIVLQVLSITLCLCRGHRLLCESSR